VTPAPVALPRVGVEVGLHAAERDFFAYLPRGFGQQEQWPVVPVKQIYPLLNKLEALGHPDVRFTIESDMGHDTWMRIFAGQDLYAWLRSHSK
jgi:hypothetical protein